MKNFFLLAFLLASFTSAGHAAKAKSKKNLAKEAKSETEAVVDPFKGQGNITPTIPNLTPEEEATILKDVRVPEGFDVTLFSNWQSANYPVYIAAAPNGDLYVSSDGNGSLGRDPGRGRVLRLRDTDKDGRADEVTEFIKNIDSPRGLIWDHDRLYLLHPPDISVHFDRDGDGASEESKILIKGIAFGFDKRPADHTTNGLELGIDGWIYIAGGDFGFLEAAGTDGRRLQHRGGGVIRFRPDGTGMELFATGTRNILGTPMSPLLDLFARDNTNDGGGWDVRFHHFSGLEDHGYPRLYKNFPDEHLAPLADYGGGSGCGSVYIHEPGFPDAWKNAPFTCDWGTNALWHHTVKREGGTFVETGKPEKFIQLSRPTDADVDAMSHVYQASWKGPAKFRWEGPELGYIARVSPRGYTPEPLPDYENLTSDQLIAQLASPSHVRTLLAQRTLLRRPAKPDVLASLVKFAANPAHPLEARVAALYAVTQRGIDSKMSMDVMKAVVPAITDPAMMPFVVRALGDMGIDQITAGKPGPAPAEHFEAMTKSGNPLNRLEATIAAARQRKTEAAPAIAALLGDEDPVIAHTAFRALAMLKADESCFAILDASNSTDDARKHAAFALMRMHEPKVVDALIARLAKETRPDVREHLIRALTRLYYRDAEWKGDSWGTRPDTRGPYYQLATWEESDKVLTALKSLLESAPPAEAAFLVKEMNRNRIQSTEALERIIVLAGTDKSLLAEAVAQIAAAESIPHSGLPLLFDALQVPDLAAATNAELVEIFMKIDNKRSLDSALIALSNLREDGKAGKQFESGQKAFLKSPKLENHHTALETLAAAEPASPRGGWANAAVIELASRKKGSPESREMSQKAVDAGWKNPAQRMALMKAAAISKNHSLDEKIIAAMSDPDPETAKIAMESAKALKLMKKDKDQTPKLATLTPENAITAVFKTKGDAAYGEALFTRATCIACHTVNQDEAQKGPYLGNIAQTYKRKELIEAILVPNKTIAQGFTTNFITMKDGEAQMGFVTDESGDYVKIRNIAAQEFTYKKADIAKRDTLPTSMMPPGLMHNFTVYDTASLVDYLEALSQKK